MAIKAEGIWGCKVLGGKAGKSDGVPTVQINVQITDGQSAGQRCTYEDVVNAQSAKYVSRSLTAVGYKGGGLDQLEADIAAWIAKTGGESTVEIKHFAVKKGKAYDKWIEGGCKDPAPIWDKVNGIGRGAARPLVPLDSETMADADAALREFMGAPTDGGPPPEDAHAAGQDGGADEIPFATCSTIGLGEIAKVLR